MKDIGRVKDYNKYYGTIINEFGDEYLFMESNKEIKKLDLVSFVPEVYEKNGIKQNIARFVEKINI